jgi:CDP-diacylglycerol--serine O-phosphatidyltransferase
MLKHKHSDRQDGVKRFTIRRLIPNMVTIIAICFGLTSLRYAVEGQLEIAVALVVIAGLLDMIDGRIARFLKVSSNFGAQLDSLADFINFGVAPAIILYIWRLKEIPIQGFGWSLVLFYSICAVVRLARFNTENEDETKRDFNKLYFTGVPTPMGAYIAGIPMMLGFNSYIHIETNYIVASFFVVLASILMISKLPTIAAKKYSVNHNNVNVFMVIFAFIVTLLIMQPWFTLPLIGLLYLISIPYTYFQLKKIQK